MIKIISSGSLNYLQILLLFYFKKKFKFFVAQGLNFVEVFKFKQFFLNYINNSSTSLKCLFKVFDLKLLKSLTL